MKRKVVLYPSVEYRDREMVHKKVVIPNQSMSLKEIIKRFVRKESLPIEQQGVYYESEYDLEKLANADMTERAEVLEKVRGDVEVKKAKLPKRPKASVDPNPSPPAPPVPVDPPKP